MLPAQACPCLPSHLVFIFKRKSIGHWVWLKLHKHGSDPSPNQKKKKKKEKKKEKETKLHSVNTSVSLFPLLVYHS